MAWLRGDEVLHTGRYLVARKDNPEAVFTVIEVIERRGKNVVLDTKDYPEVKNFDSQCRFLFVPEIDDAD
ncbi:MAG: hypothetical protein JWO15_3542 [Sphingomonadales bacterium]|nr:hypothetical protein [Sphingomonadales bacterium]